MKLRSVGFDLSDRSIKFVELKETKHGFVLGKYGRETVPPGILQSGKIIDKEKLKNIIKSLHGKTTTPYVRMALPEEQVYLFSIRLPKSKPKEVETAIELSLEDNIPIPAQDAVFDYECVKEDKDHMDFVVVASPRQTIEDYVSMFDGTGFIPLSFELEAQAIARSIVKDKTAGVVMVVDIGETRTGISVIEDGHVVLASTVEIGGASLTDLIQKKLGVSRESAEKWKKEFGLESHNEAPELPETIMGSLSALHDEINKAYVYWHNHKDENEEKRGAISSIFLCGGESALPGLPQYLSSTMGVSVSLGNPWVNITDLSSYVPEINQKDSLAYATAIGLALAENDK